MTDESQYRWYSYSVWIPSKDVVYTGARRFLSPEEIDELFVTIQAVVSGRAEYLRILVKNDGFVYIPKKWLEEAIVSVYEHEDEG